MTPLRAEYRKLRQLALPVVAANVGTMLMGMVDAAMVGHLSVDALAAAALANVWVYGTFLFAQGVVFGMDPLVSQAHGAGEGDRAGLALQRGLVVALLVSIPLGLLWLLSGRFLALAGQDLELARAAHRYTQVQIPSVPFFMAFVALRQYLQGRELMRPAMWVVAVANVFNAICNWVLIFGHLGMPALGLVGAGIATALTRVVMLLLLLGLMRGFSLHAGAWVPWSRAALEPRGLGQIFAVGIPVALQVGLEVWAFSGSTLLAGLLGADSVAAHTITLNLAAFAFMVPLGISQGAATRVGNLLGARRSLDARRAAWVALIMGAGVMLLAALIFLVGREMLPRLWTRDAGVIALSASILPIAAAFAIFDGTQVVGCGVLRGMGDTRPAARFNLLGYWILGLPLGAWFAFRADAGLAGVWWGLALGLLVVAALVVLRLRRRGPETVVALPTPG